MVISDLAAIGDGADTAPSQARMRNWLAEGLLAWNAQVEMVTTDGCAGTESAPNRRTAPRGRGDGPLHALRLRGDALGQSALCTPGPRMITRLPDRKSPHGTRTNCQAQTSCNARS